MSAPHVHAQGGNKVNRTLSFITIIALVLTLLTSCRAIETPEPSPLHTPELAAPVFEQQPAPELDDPDAEVFYALKAEFERNLELAGGEEDGYWDWSEVWEYRRECQSIFEEMLDYRQSLDYFNESMPLLCKNELLNPLGHIDIWPVFSDGETNYRVLEFWAQGWPPYRMVYIQIYDEMSVESHIVDVYVNEGGVLDEIIYCGFEQAQNKTYLTIIHKVTTVDPIRIRFKFANYEIYGKEIRNYNALSEEFSNTIWRVSGSYFDYYELTYTELCYVPGRPYELSDYSWCFNTQYSFENNILTITMDNEEKDEISLLFNDGFWEVVLFS